MSDERILDKDVVRERLLEAFEKLDKIYSFDINVELLDVTTINSLGVKELIESGLVEIKIIGSESV